MNGRHAGPSVAALMGFFLIPVSAWGRPDTLQFDVTGAITPSCALVANRINIDLGAVSVSELPAVGEGSQWGAAAFIGAECIGATRASVTVRAAPAGDPRYVATTGDARGVAIALRTGSGQPVLPDGVTPVHFELAGPSPELRFEARYVRVGPLHPGEAAGTALVQITWE